jgi:PilZ domain/Gram-negative bacterial TonB protein C-terminal
MSATLQQIPAIPTLLPKERRFYSRIAPKTPIRFAIDDQDVLMLNLSENGLLVFTPVELTANRVSHISIPLSGLPAPLQVNVRVVWANRDRKVAGVQLLNLSDHDRERVREWIADAPKPSFSSPSNQPRVSKPFLAPVTPPETPGTPKLVETPRDIGSPPLSEAQSSTSTPKAAVEDESTSETPVKLKWLLLGLVICLAGVFLHWTGALGNPSARSQKALHATISANSAAPNAHISNTTASPSLVPESPKSNGNRLPNAATANSARSQDGLGGPQNDQPADRTIGIPDLRTKTTSFGSLPVGTTNPETSLAFPLRPIQSEAHENSTRTNDAGSASTTIPTAPSLSTVPVAPLKPDTPVIHKDVPQRQVVEVHLPGGYRSPFVDLPGGRVVDTPAVSIRMYRSIHLPTTFAEASLRDGKVVVGELISPIDSLVSAAQLGPTEFVHVHATIGEDGRVGTVTFIHGPSDLSPDVVKAIREWRYQLTLVNGQPVETQCDIEVRFRSPARRTPRR